ncbi:MAG: histidinol-phosphate transaminase [Arenicellales bacterium]
MSVNLFDLATPGVQKISPYQPGRPAEEVAAEFGIDKPVKLASNENPLGPSPLAINAMQAVHDLARYPDGSGAALKNKIAVRHQLDVGCITLGNGSNDILEFITRAFVNPGDEVIFSQHAFAVYPLATLAVSGKPVETPALNWGNDLQAIVEAVTDRSKVIFIANPNNPTGTWLTGAELKSFMDQVPQQVIVVIDEAYAEYATEDAYPGYPDCTQWLSDYPNLLVTRTFSKIFGLAGLRVGYGVSSPELADFLNRVRQPFNVNSLALIAAEAALDDDHHVKRSREMNQAGMVYLADACKTRGLKYIPSAGNFLAIDFSRPAEGIFKSMMQQGVIVRPISNYGMPDFLRVTIGSEDENRRFIEVLDRVTETDV